MRNTCFKAMLLGLAVAGWMAGSVPAHAQDIQLLNWQSEWKYVDSGTNLLTAWRTNSYPYPEPTPLWKGPAAGLFGYEPDTPNLYDPYGGIWTSLWKYTNGASSGTQVMTYYFRTLFNWSSSTYGSPTNYYLVVSNVVDDGVLVYLNGMLLITNRVSPNATYTASATGQPSPEGDNEVFDNLSVANLRSGNNLVAAEMHQQGTASSDAVFGMTLTAVKHVPIAIKTQPASKTVDAGSNVTFSVTLTAGTVPYYLWYRVTNNTTGASFTNLVDHGFDAAQLDLSNVTLTNAGTYFVVVTNGVTRIQSANAVLTVKMYPLLITQQPHNLDAVLGSKVSLSVEVSGSMPAGQSRYWWYQITNNTKPPVLKTGNTNEYWITSFGNTSTGKYFVVISNALTVVTSDVVSARIVPDVFGPKLSFALIENYSPDVVKISFFDDSKALNMTKDVFDPLFEYSPWNPANYTVTTFDTRGTNLVPVPVLAVTNVVGTNVFLKIDGTWNRKTNYMVTVNGVADKLANVIAPNSWIPIAFQEITNVVAWRESYHFASSVGVWDPESYTDLIKTNDPIAWTKLNYDDSNREPFYNWSEGGGAFGKSIYSTYPNWACTVLGTYLSEGATTQYFRNRFSLGIGTNLKNISDINAIMSYVIDDGAIFYINGKEVKRVNMPAGAVTYTTLANGSAGAATCILNQSVDVDGVVVNGNNLFAVEVHQVGRPDPEHDVYFDASLWVSWMRTPTPPTETNKITISKVFDVPNKTVQVFSTNKTHNLAIDMSESIDGPWLQAQPASTNMTFSLTNKAQYFRLRNYR